MHVCIACMDGWVDGWMVGWKDGWRDGSCMCVKLIVSNLSLVESGTYVQRYSKVNEVEDNTYVSRNLEFRLWGQGYTPHNHTIWARISQTRR